MDFHFWLPRNEARYMLKGKYRIRVKGRFRKIKFKFKNKIGGEHWDWRQKSSKWSLREGLVGWREGVQKLLRNSALVLDWSMNPCTHLQS